MNLKITKFTMYVCSSLFQQLGYTPLTMACEKGYLEVVQKLIEAEADVNLCDLVSDYIIIITTVSYILVVLAIRSACNV